ncbi:hypothetical protein E1301_Tti024323 [Triplophysa tibetana]|uniref:G-protein coupled receptors family 1 profile domain-containing protein n=1 Tax=Triplophysa tibetana TaxID=1572043 RepID=A0A5A9MRQ2_9TELE|nr:hypothetical protein E1301_Tti024323 [Triplophysa tibetana]
MTGNQQQVSPINPSGNRQLLRATLYKMSTTPDYTDYFSERYENQTEKEPYQYQIRMMYLVTYGIVLVLGLSLNVTLVFVGWQRYKSYKKIAIWVLALAATHLIFCGPVVFQLLYAYYDFEWYYGTVTCKLSSYITYGSMYSTATILSLWSFSSAFSKSACIKRSKNCNIFQILFSWTLAAVLAMPSLFSREIQLVRCVDDYDFDDFTTSPDAIKKLKAVVVSRFLFGLFIPAFVMFVSCCVATKSIHNGCVQFLFLCIIKKTFIDACTGSLADLSVLERT